MKRYRKKILVLRYRFIGDTILTIPFLRNLRRAEPDAFIAWVVAPGSSDPILGVPYVDELIYWDPQTIHADSRGGHRTWKDKIDFILNLRRRRFDKVYVLKRSLSSALIALLSGASERVGFDTEGRGLLLTKKVSYRHDRHEVENFLDVLRGDGIEVRDNHLEAWLNVEERHFASRYLKEKGCDEKTALVGMHCFAANAVRAWHMADFVAVANTLQKQYGVRIVIFGGPRDVEQAEYFRENIKPEPVIAVGSNSIRESMALMECCSLMICNDSGIMHLAASLRVPLVAIFGPQSPAKFGPWGEMCRVVYSSFPCSPCRQRFFTECQASRRGKPECLEVISVDHVLDAIETLNVSLFGGSCRH